jgi:hypothetical protein
MALKKGRPPNVVKLFPNSKALIVSGKFIERRCHCNGCQWSKSFRNSRCT